MRDAGVIKDEIAGLGLGTSGHVDHYNGRVITNSNLPGFTDYPIGERLESATNLPVSVDNDANAQAYAEYLFGSAKGYDNAVFVTVSTGIGAGIVIDGRLYRGVTGTAGEIGHTIVDPHSTVRCGCGNYGCLMSHASGLALPQVVRQKLRRPGVETIIDFTQLSDGEITGELIGRGFTQGEPLRRVVSWDYGDYLGIGLQNLFQTLDPGVIVVGGGLSNWGEPYLDRIRSRFYQTAGTMLAHPLEIRRATLESNAAVIGAAALVLEPT
jgi:glucokinase